MRLSFVYYLLTYLIAILRLDAWHNATYYTGIRVALGWISQKTEADGTGGILFSDLSVSE